MGSFVVEKITGHTVNKDVRWAHARPHARMHQLTRPVLGNHHVQGQVGGLREEGRPDLGARGQPEVRTTDPVALTATC